MILQSIAEDLNMNFYCFDCEKLICGPDTVYYFSNESKQILKENQFCSVCIRRFHDPDNVLPAPRNTYLFTEKWRKK